MGEQLKMTADIQPMRMPNFVNANVLGQYIKLDVGSLTTKDVENLWDEWRKDWLKHCQERTQLLAQQKLVESSPNGPAEGAK